jgi:uncharacterized protein (DUF433 family)
VANDPKNTADVALADQGLVGKAKDTLAQLTVPLRKDADGTLRVGNSRVVIDVVIDEFHNGACPEEIAHNYPTLQLADVYGVIAYYLRHQEEIDQYMAARAEAADRLRQEIEAKQPWRTGLREKLLARKAKMEKGHAASGDG